jgi:elongation factor Ts
VKQPEKSVKEKVTDLITKIGENIQIRRFTRYQLGA